MFKSISFFFREHFKNRALISKLAKVKMSQTTVRSTLGIWWIYIHDILYFSAFILFRILLTGNSNVYGMHGVVYLMTGLVPWLLIGEIMNSATSSIKSNKIIIQSIRFPVILLPTVDFLAVFRKRIVTFLFIFVTVTYYGYLGQFNILKFIYYLTAMGFILLGSTHFLSALIAISNDFQQFHIAIMKVLFFTLPIMWDFGRIQGTKYEILGRIVKFNPFVFIIQGFRDCFVNGQAQKIIYHLYFWIIAFIIFGLGCFIQKKLAKYYSDFV